MAQILLIGIGAGVATALLFASQTSGSILALPLVVLSPLPIILASLGWTYWAGLVATICSAIVLAIVIGPGLFPEFLVRIGLPAWWLSYLAMLARPAEGPGKDGMEWYPVGNLIVWAAVLGAVGVIVLIPFIANDVDSLRLALRESTSAMSQAALPENATSEMRERMKIAAEALASVALPLTAALTTLMLLFNLWLAGRVARVSGQLRRPWPDLPSITFPRFAAVLFAAAIAGILLPDPLAIVSDVLSASFLVAYAMLGLAVLHALTIRVAGRGMMLTGVYVATVVFWWPTLILSLLALADSALDLRGRVLRRRGPPTLH